MNQSAEINKNCFFCIHWMFGGILSHPNECLKKGIIFKKYIESCEYFERDLRIPDDGKDTYEF